jgi:hypothetical protein
MAMIRQVTTISFFSSLRAFRFRANGIPVTRALKEKARARCAGSVRNNERLLLRSRA